MNTLFGAKDVVSGSLIARPTIGQAMKFGGRFKMECFGPKNWLGRRKLKWVEEFPNLVVDVGLDDILEQYFNGSGYTALHYVGLCDGTPTVAAGDTMASHVGWVKVTAYSEGVRPTYNPAAASGQSITNTASKAVFSIDTDTTTIGGAFITDTVTKGGATGLLVSAGAFTAGDKGADNGDTLNVTYQYDASSS